MSDVKVHGSTVEVHLKLAYLSTGGGSGIPGVEVKFVDIGGIPVAKATTWPDTDTEVRKRGEQTGLDTLVVHAVNDVN